ncbi:MAG: RbsD/FucU family protein [Spirochaetota bacterium]
MLKGVPSILNPELLKILMEMGHGDEITIGDGNFPAASMAQRLVRCDGHGVPELLDAILTFFPLDTFVDAPVALMAVGAEQKNEPAIWEQYREIVRRRSPDATGIENVERFAFYERAKKTYAIVATGERAIYANVILKKGVVFE